MSSAPSEEPSGPAAKYAGRRWWALAALSLGLFMASLDNTILNVALPTLARVLGASTDQLQWTVDAYMVTFAGLLLVAGALVDRWGKKQAFLTGTVLFALFSLFAGLSANSHTLIIARALMGVGAALLTPSTLALVSALFTDAKERTLAFAIWSGANAAGGAAGPLLAGLLLEHFRWGSVFLINVPVALIVVPMGLFALPKLAPKQRLSGLDIVGALLSTTALGMICWAVISAPGLGMFNPLIIGSAIIGVVALMAFIAREHRYRNPILHLSLFGNQRFAVAVAVGGMVTAGGAGALFILTQYLQFSLGYSPLASGLRVLPMAAALGLGALCAPRMIQHLAIKNTVLVGLAAVGLGLAWMGLADVNWTYDMLLPGALLFGFGAGVLNPAATQAVMDALPPASAGVGSATNTAMIQMGSALGVAITGSLLATRYRDVLTSSPVFTQIGTWQRTALDSIAGALRAASELSKPLADQLVILAQRGFVAGMRLGMMSAALAVLVAGTITFLQYPSDYHQRQNANHPRRRQH